MRLKHAKLTIIFIIIVDIILFYFFWDSFPWKGILDINDSNSLNFMKSSKGKLANKHIRKSITIVFRNFYNFENDLKTSIDSIFNIVPNIPIVIVQDSIPYPPFFYQNNITSGRVIQIINLAFDIKRKSNDLYPLNNIKTKYVLFMPDSVRIFKKTTLQKILKEANNISIDGENGNPKLLIIPFFGNTKSFSNCCHINFDFPNWTVEYRATNSNTICDLYLQKHAIMADVNVLKNLPEPLGTPFPEMLYFQAKIANLKKIVMPINFQDGKHLFTSYHTKQRRLEIRRKQFKEMYKKLQIKRIIRKSYKINTIKNQHHESLKQQQNIILDPEFSLSNNTLPLITEIDLIGCERNTKSCIGTVYNSKPFYIYLHKNTPPCCKEKLEAVFHHIVKEFENIGIRYWLDNLTLRNAIETGQLASDAHEIDISFNIADIERSIILKKCQMHALPDNEGYYCIRATDGNYYRYQYSKINQIGVNLLPYEINDNNAKPNGFFGWKAAEFSAEYLHPMSTVFFLGKSIMCPNNVREFLNAKGIK